MSKNRPDDGEKEVCIFEEIENQPCGKSVVPGSCYCETHELIIPNEGCDCTKYLKNMSCPEHGITTPKDGEIDAIVRLSKAVTRAKQAEAKLRRVIADLQEAVWEETENPDFNLTERIDHLIDQGRDDGKHRQEM